ncbi:MAG: Dabb family protein [Micrococcaceae bacterium]
MEPQNIATDKPFQHNVSFRLNIEDKNVEQRLFEKAAQLKQIVGVTSLSFGENITPETENKHGYNYGLTVQFTNYQALLDYQDDPTHVEFKDFIKPYFQAVIVVDYPLR